MTDEQTVQPDSATPETAEPNAPTDFKGYVTFRKTGELPATETEQPAAAEETPAKTEPQSGADDKQQLDEEEERPEDELTASQKRRRRRMERLAVENEHLKQQLATVQQPQPAATPKAEPPGKPRLENYGTLEEYQEALTDWHITQREAKRQAEAEARASEEAAQKLQAEWDSRQTAARKAHPDYDDVIDTVAAPEGPGVAAARQAMLEDDAGAEILYYLATHKDDLKRIAALPPIAAVREIGRLSATLSPSSGAANGKQRFTAAPPPPPPSTRPAKTVTDSIFDPAVQSDFKRWVKARAQMKDR
jgi:hypothetical protein